MLRAIACAALIGIWAGAGVAAPVVSADLTVKVQAQSSADAFMCIVEVGNQNDDDSPGTKLVVLLPLQVHYGNSSVTGGPGTCTPSPINPPGTNFNGYVICDLGTLQNKPGVVQRTVRVRTSKSTATDHPSTCSAFAYGLRGDPDKKSNYGWAP
jgi:hypothetical protein